MFELTRLWPDADRQTVAHAQPGQRGNEGSTHGTPVTTWVEAYTDIILGLEAVELPHVLLLDSTTFHRRYGGPAGRKDGPLGRAPAA